KQTQVQRIVFKKPCNQCFVGSAPFFIRRARCVVCGGLAGIFKQPAWLGFLVGGRLSGGLGDWLWHCPIYRSTDYRQSTRQGSWWWPRLPVGTHPDGYSSGYCTGHECDQLAGDSSVDWWFIGIRRRVCDQFIAAQLFDCELREVRWRFTGC